MTDWLRTDVESAESFQVGTWLSLVEHSLGVRGVGSSNLPVPTNNFISPFQELAGIPSFIFEFETDPLAAG